jgi:hypothetical protein
MLMHEYHGADRVAAREGDVAGYHYYPGREQAVEWFGREDLAIADEGFRREDGWGYRHFLLRTRG